MYGPLLKLKALGSVPALICASVIALALALQALPRWFPGLDLFQRLELLTYDWRMRQAAARSTAEPTVLAAVYIDEESVRFFNERLHAAWPWPRQFHARLVRMLAGQGAQAIGFDILFDLLHPDTPQTRVATGDGGRISSDAYFGAQLRAAGNVALAVMSETSGRQWKAIVPADWFRTNAWALGHISSDKDSDGVLRRAKAFHEDPRHGRIWHLGIVLAARHLGIDLNRAVVTPRAVVLRGAGGVERRIPLTPSGYFYINWCLAWNDARMARGSFAEVAGFRVGGAPPDWRGKLVVVGSILAGNNVSDVGATSLSKETYLVSKHWNVAHSIITGRFVHPAPAWLHSALIVLLGLLASGLTWKFRAPWPTVAVAGTVLAYGAVATWLFVRFRFWVPVVLPLLVAHLMNHVGLVTYQVLFEQKEKRRVKGVFARLVSPDVVNELLNAKRINLGGSRRHLTVMFADVRGFTEFTDTMQGNAETHVRQHALAGAEADAYFTAQAQATLETVNAYLSAVAEQVKHHHGTLDKYVGDCVVAFWGAPLPNPQHALCCVRAAIDAQRAIHALNRERRAENQRREQANPTRLAAGQPPLPLLPVLDLGTGINTGTVIVGLMGSEAHILNYTVFGRDVNLASRLEGVSGRSRILIGEPTFRELQRDAPSLAASCRELESVAVKGIREKVRTYEVPWRDDSPASLAPAPES